MEGWVSLSRCHPIPSHPILSFPLRSVTSFLKFLPSDNAYSVCLLDCVSPPPQAQDKRGLLGAVAMAAVQSLHTPSLTPIAAAEAPDLQTAENMPNISGRASGPQNARRGRGGGGRGGGSKRGGGPGGSGRGRGRRHGHEGGRVGVEAGGAETMTGVRGTEGSSKASMAVAEMLDGASDCADMDEIFKSLSSVLAAAQEESRQVIVVLYTYLVLYKRSDYGF